MKTNSDTISLLKECDAGTKMAVATIDEILEKVCDSDMKQMLQESKREHEKLGDEIHRMLNRHNSEEKDPALMAKGMSWLKTNIKMGIDASDAAVADLVTDGCDMGAKTLHKYLNEYQEADAASKKVCRELIDAEEQLCKGLRSYL